MDVYAERRELKAQLKRALSDEFVVVAGPDHPLLLSGPDLLVGGRGGLTAILCVAARERAQPKLAVARFALMKMALPSHARFVLIADDQDAGVAKVLERDVGVILSMANKRERAELSAIAENPSRVDGRPVPEKLRAQAHERFSTTYRVSRAVRQRGARFGVSAVSDEYFGDNVRRVAGNSRAFSRLSLLGSERSFRVDSGVPYLTGEPSVPVLAENIPEFPGDPEKYARASAFAGWAVATGGLPKEGRLMDLLDQRTRYQ